MSFTDDDLKQLKERLTRWDTTNDRDTIEAILARLEAAENFVKAVMQDDPSYGDMPEWRAWRNATFIHNASLRSKLNREKRAARETTNEI